MQSYEYKSVQDTHHEAMEARARENGKALPAPRVNSCDHVQAAGFNK